MIKGRGFMFAPEAVNGCAKSASCYTKSILRVVALYLRSSLANTIYDLVRGEFDRKVRSSEGG